MKILKKKNRKLKLAKVENINLKELKFKRVICEENELGDSTNTFREKRFILNGKKQVFKTYDGDFGQNIKNFRINSELICYYLGNQIGVKCAKVRPATYDNHTGTISEISLKKNDVLLNGEELVGHFFKSENFNSIDCYEKYFSFLKNLKSYKVNKDRLSFDLFKVCVFDYLTQQQDRHCQNIHFVKRVENGKVSIYLYPLIDNEYAFAGFTYAREIKTKKNINVNSIELSVDNSRLAVSRNNLTKYGFIFSQDSEAQEIVEYAITRTKCLDFLHNVLNTYDVKQIIEELKSQGFKFSKEEELWRISICEKQKIKIKNELEKQKNMSFEQEIARAVELFNKSRSI